MGKKLKNSLKKTSANIDTGARTIVNGPLFIIEILSYVCLKILYIFKIWVVFPVIMFLAYLEVYGSKDGGGRTSFVLSDFISYAKFLVKDQMDRGVFVKTTLMLFAASVGLTLVIYFIRVRIVGSIYAWAMSKRDDNNRQIQYNNDVVKHIETKGKFNSDRDFLKDKLKDFKNSDDYQKR